MKKIFLGLLSLALVFVFVSVAGADVNAVTPSTNDANRALGWAHVDQISMGVGETDLQFISTRAFWSCFEYRTDGDTSQVIGENGGVNYNTDITDGLYPYYCQNNNNRTETIEAEEYVEVRMVFGGERDERFDWTRFDVLYNRTADITSPNPGEAVSGLVDFTAYLNDDDADSIQWAVREGTCAAGVGTVFGNVDGHHDVATIDQSDLSMQTFSFTGDMTGMTLGMYCFIYNPVEDSGESNIRLTREFELADTVAPLVELYAPLDGEALNGLIDISGFVTDDVELSHYNLSLYPETTDLSDGNTHSGDRILAGWCSGTVNLSLDFTGDFCNDWDTTNYADGEYQIRLAARDAAGNRDMSDPYNGGTSSVHVISIVIDNYPETMNECKKGGWELWTYPSFRNQGDCVSWVQSNENAWGNRKDNVIE